MRRMIAAGRIKSNAGQFEDQREVHVWTDVLGTPYGYRVLLDTDMPPEFVKDMTSFALKEIFNMLNDRQEGTWSSEVTKPSPSPDSGTARSSTETSGPERP